MNSPLSEEVLQQIKAAIFARRKIQAIKTLRDATQLSLADAKQWVEHLTEELETKEPEKFTAQGNGCSTALCVLAVLVALLWGGMHLG